MSTIDKIRREREHHETGHHPRRRGAPPAEAMADRSAQEHDRADQDVSLESASKQVPAPATVTEAQAHMFIINPFKGRGAQFARLFMTHPSTDDRVERLERMARQGI